MPGTTLDGDVTKPRHDSRTWPSGETTADPGASLADGGEFVVSLICLSCTARTFLEFSVNPAAEVAFRYGDDGLAMAMELTLEVAGIRTDLLPMAKVVSGDGSGVGSARSSDVVGSQGECVPSLMTHLREKLSNDTNEGGTLFPSAVVSEKTETEDFVFTTQFGLTVRFA